MRIRDDEGIVPYSKNYNPTLGEIANTDTGR
jgi:hypothetical protein